jgi:O-antigen ligase
MATSTLAETASKVRDPAAPSRWLGRIWGVWLALFSIASFTLRPPPVRNTVDLDQYRDPGPKLAIALLLLAMASVGPAVWAAMTMGVDFRRARFVVIPVLLICLSIPLSFIGTGDPQSIIYIIVVYTVLGAGLVSASANVDREAALRSLMTTVAITQGLVMVWVIKDHDYFYGRLFGRVQPNYWGEVAEIAVCAAIAMRGWVLRSAVIGVGLYTIYATQSRGSMVAVAVALIAAFILYTITSPKRAQLWIAAILVAIFVGVAGSGFIANDLFKMSDPRRGATSGLTGRSAAWSETLDLIQAHPFVGVGYRQHEKYLHSESSAHNAYLATMADTGVIGFFAYMLFVLGGLCCWVVKNLTRPSLVSLACAAYLLSFMVDGMFEREALNTGNAFSQLMILLAIWAWRQDQPGAIRR